MMLCGICVTVDDAVILCVLCLVAVVGGVVFSVCREKVGVYNKKHLKKMFVCSII